MSALRNETPASPDADENWQTESEETNDDDIDFEPASDGMTPSGDDEYMDEDDETNEEDEETENGETTLYYDAEDGTLRTSDGEEIMIGEDVEVEEETADEDDEINQEGETTVPQPTAEGTRRIQLTQQQLVALLSQAGFAPFFRSVGGNNAAEDDDDDDDFTSSWGYGGRRTRRRRTFEGERYPAIPSANGKQLMVDGTFGSDDRCRHTVCGRPLNESSLTKRKRLARRVLDRELGLENRGRLRALNALASQKLIPGSKADLIINFNARCYSGQFSEDGSFFFACGQDFKVRMYDTSNPYDWKYYKTVSYPGGQWTITDASLSPDNKFLAYSSIRSQVCLANTEQGDRSDPQYLDFTEVRTGRGAMHRFGRFGIWSLRFSGDGGEIVAGTSDNSVYVYDLESRKTILRIPGHTDDVNAVCFGDKMSPHILYSGSDDTTLKVWDRRSLASMRPAGLFLGHTEGLTYIDSKGDGRYVISNGKDQTCKLWDLRKMISTDEGEKINPARYTTNFDYRFAAYPMEEHEPHPLDCSLVTFRGHRVLQTLIRCHFSPPGSTDGRYIYSGSHDGKIYVWNLDGTEAAPPIDVKSATENTRSTGDRQYVDRYEDHDGSRGWKTIVRDCSWHPSAPVIAATSWNGWDHGLGTCTVHTWNDDVDVDEQGDVAQHADGLAFANASSLGASPMGARVNPELQHDASFYPRPRGSTRRSRGLRGGLARLINPGYDEDEDE